MTRDAERNAGADFQGSSWIRHLMPDFREEMQDKTAQCQSGSGRTWRIWDRILQ